MSSSSTPHPIYEQVLVPNEETWKAIPGFEGLYECSTCGRVKSLDRIISHPRLGYQTIKGRILKPGPARDNKYLMHIICREGRKYSFAVATLVLTTFVCPCPEGPTRMIQIRHLDDNGKNNHLINLTWGTAKENAQDRINNGGQIRGEKHHFSKLTEKQVVEIRSLYATGKYRYHELGKMFGVGRNVEHIIHGTTYAHIKQFLPPPYVQPPQRRKLDKNEIIEIRQKFDSGRRTMKELSKEHDLVYSCIRNIVRRITHGDIP